ncbi:hypothetical protein K458DRAFT_113166 [Lentithecium fluviatile CBS 122367]|uniref:Uncharacterized protein n=1 Tax=Lentithecium fluviatile CBS 122367 TaxID=1168545 RepID=A0A6G1INK4_9PLEO|nr:hypothetical protein K458DRAFT_113166 [Lentithecium fluviatile CBS 122367]
MPGTIGRALGTITVIGASNGANMRRHLYGGYSAPSMHIPASLIHDRRVVAGPTEQRRDRPIDTVNFCEMRNANDELGVMACLSECRLSCETHDERTCSHEPDTCISVAGAARKERDRRRNAGRRPPMPQRRTSIGPERKERSRGACWTLHTSRHADTNGSNKTAAFATPN